MILSSVLVPVCLTFAKTAMSTVLLVCIIYMELDITNQFHYTSFVLYQGDSSSGVVAGVQVNPRTGSRLKAETRCDGAPLPPASPRFARHNHNHLGESPRRNCCSWRHYKYAHATVQFHYRYHCLTSIFKILNYWYTNLLQLLTFFCFVWTWLRPSAEMCNTKRLHEKVNLQLITAHTSTVAL